MTTRPAVLGSPSLEDIVAYLDRCGTTQPSRVGPTREARVVTLWWPLGTVPTRVGQARYLGDLEASMVLTGAWRPDAVSRWCPRVDLSLFEPYARYGPLARTQVRRVVRLLARDPSSRRALLVLARPNVPACNMTVQFLARHGCVDVVAYARSIDVTRGLPYDARTWTVVGSVVAESLGLARGTLSFVVGSLHAYLSDLTIGKLHDGGYSTLCPVPALDVAVQLAHDFLNGGTPWLQWTAPTRQG